MCHLVWHLLLGATHAPPAGYHLTWTLGLLIYFDWKSLAVVMADDELYRGGTNVPRAPKCLPNRIAIDITELLRVPLTWAIFLLFWWFDRSDVVSRRVAGLFLLVTPSALFIGPETSGSSSGRDEIDHVTLFCWLATTAYVELERVENTSLIHSSNGRNDSNLVFSRFRKSTWFF